MQLSRNLLEFLFLDSIQNLSIINLSGRSLTAILNDTFAIVGQRLEQIVLSENTISLIETDALSYLIILNYLDISDNKLERIDSQLFRSLCGLEKLNLNKNQIEEIEHDSFLGCENLYEINMACNRLTGIDNIGFRPQNIHLINFANNQLSTINFGLFRFLENLEVLNLSSNLIEELEERCFDDLKSLKILKLENNRIDRIDWKLFRNLRSIKLLTVFNNARRFLSFKTNEPFDNFEDSVHIDNIIREHDEGEYLTDWNQFLQQLL